jgi:nucleotide-binding universal stress UspA family protein
MLVPLDGSELAERALPIAAHLARATGSALVLVQVLPLTTWAFAVPGSQATYDQTVPYYEIIDDEDRATRSYLSQVADKVRGSDLVVQTLAVRGDPAGTLIDLEPQVQAGLVVMASHGRTGLSRFALGSVADRVARHGYAPVLVVRPFGESQPGVQLADALVPLDGSPLAERALDIVAGLAEHVISRVTLARVVNPERHAGETDEAERSLEEARARLQEQLDGRACAIEITILYGKPADQIIQRSERACDLVIMATHGRTGATRWAFGSVADRVLRGIRVPLLLVRALRPT